MAFWKLVNCRNIDWRGSCWSSVEVRPRNATRTFSCNRAAGIPSGDSRLIANIENALGWSGPSGLGREFTRGRLPERDLCARLLTPSHLLNLVMRRSLAPHRLQCLVDGEFVHPHRYLTMVSARRGESVMADMERLGPLLRSGCTLVVDQANTYDPTMEVACRALQW